MAKAIAKRLVHKFRELAQSIFSTWCYGVFRFRAWQSSVGKTKPQILLFRTDAIGDYILFRNVLPAIRRYADSMGCSLSLVGNIAWKDLATSFDSRYVDSFVWIDFSRFNRSSFDQQAYTLGVKLDLARSRYREIYHCVYSRTEQVDLLIRDLPSAKKVAMRGDVVNRRGVVDSRTAVYDVVLDLRPSLGVFEFHRNQDFVLQAMGQTVEGQAPRIDPSELPQAPGPLPLGYVAMHVDGSGGAKVWALSKFEIVALRCIVDFKLPVVLLGSRSSEPFLPERSSDVLDFRGRTTLPESAAILKGASIFLGNDSSLLHMASAVGVPKLVGLCFGQYYGRFVPYPPLANRNYRFLFPPAIRNRETQPQTLWEEYSDGRHEDIQLIEPELVIQVISELLKGSAHG